MKKIISLIRATMTSDMNIFKIRTKKDNHKSNIIIMLLISLFFMIAIWSYANILFEKLAPLNLQSLVISLFVFFTAFMTIIEGIYKSSSLIFNCRDDQLLLSLPIKKTTILFIRIFKFYVFELIYHSLFIIPLIVAYIRWTSSIEWTLFLITFIMLFTLPIIPIIISTFIGAVSTSISSRFKYKKLTQTLISMIVILFIFYLSYQIDDILNFIAKNANSINDIITKIYYPAGIYSRLIEKFNILDLIIYITINISLFIMMIIILSKYYFKINSRLKIVESNKKRNTKLKIKSKSIINSLIYKELLTFLNTPVFIINAGFSLFLFIIISIMMVIKYDLFISILASTTNFNLQIDFINNNISLLIFILIAITSFMTSITNSVISLEGRNINILKSLPISTKTILLSKIYSSLILTTPVLIIGIIILVIRFKINFLTTVLLLLLSILTPLISHFVGLIINLKFPKLDAENAAEVVKQSTSSFLSVMLGMLFLILTVSITIKISKILAPISILVLFIIAFIIINIILYIFLIKISIKDFDNLTI